LAAAVAIGFAAEAHAQKSPVGTWEFLISGSQGVGIAYLTFKDDFSFSGQELLTTKTRKASEDVARGGEGIGRYPTSGSSTNVSKSTTNLFGFGAVEGPWIYDAKGRVTGYFVEEVSIAGSTNVVRNSVAFTAKVVPGKRMTLAASTANGKVTYSGVPISTSLPNLTGSWNGLKKEGKQKFVELFDLFPNATGPYLFNMTGTGAGYSFDGLAMVSARKKIGFTSIVTPDGSTNTILRSVVGTFNPRKSQAKTKGAELGTGTISFDASRY
jgi:hypothetical protein